MIPHLLELIVLWAAVIWLAACSILIVLALVIVAIDELRPRRKRGARLA